MPRPDPSLSMEDWLSIADQPFKLLLDTLPFPAFIIARGGQAVHYNAAFLDYHGGHPGFGYADRAAMLHPEDQPVLAAARADAAPLDVDYVVEVRLRRHDGVFRWHRVHNKPLFQDGERVAYLGTATDVHGDREAAEVLERRVRERTTELEASNHRLAVQEARFRELYDRTPMALQSADGTARLVDVNDTWIETFGYSRTEVLGRSPTDFMTPESAREYRERAWPAMLASGGEVRIVDYQFVTASGRVFDGRLAARGVFDAEGNLIRTWSAIADVTAEKRADLGLRQAQRLEAVGQLTAGLAHDFNNLLTAILGNLELAARGLLPDDRRLRLIEGARTAGRRGARLTGQLLAFSRQQRIVAEPVDVNLVLEGMRSLLASTAGGSIVIDVAPEPDLPLAMADPTQLELAILNLVINARDALGSSGRIVVSTRAVTAAAPDRPEEPDAGTYVAVEVGDDGPGIPPEVRNRIFEPFFTTKGVGRGSGLGLAQVLGIAKQLGGGVRVGTALGRGTTVCVLLPRAAAGLVVAPGTPGPAHAASPGRAARILLVDDDPDVRTTAGAMLRQAGHSVIETGCAVEALAALAPEAGAIDLLLADVAMPGTGGAALAAEVRGTWPGIPVLFMTGYADTALLPEALWPDVLAKPFDAATLEARVSLALQPKLPADDPGSLPGAPSI